MSDCNAKLSDLVEKAVKVDRRIPASFAASLVEGRTYFYGLFPFGSSPDTWRVYGDTENRIQWTINRETGVIERFDETHSRGVRELSVGELDVLLSAGIARGLNNELIVHVPWELGSGGPIPDLVEFLRDVGVGLSSDLLFQVVRDQVSRRRPRGKKATDSIDVAEKISTVWRKQNLTIMDFRQFLDTREAWRLKDVRQFLGLSKGDSKRILSSLGYVKRGRIMGQRGRRRVPQKTR